MPDDLEEAVQKWLARMERNLRGLQDAGEDETLRETLDALSKHVEAWQLLYRPPPPPELMQSVPRLPPFSSRTVGG